MDTSVIIPVFNAAKFVEKAVESALQLKEVKEVLLVEDGSPDNALEICQELEQKHDRVKLFQHPDKKNHGAGASRNLGLMNASCPFIAFLDADDFFLANRFDADKRVFEENLKADGVYNAIGVHFYSDSGKKLFKEQFANEITTIKHKAKPEEVFPGMIGLKGDFGYFHLDGLTIKKEALANLDRLFNEDLRLHQDTDFIFRLAYYLRLYPGSINEPVALRGVHDGNRITNLRKDVKKVNENQKLLWGSLYSWSQTVELKENEKDLFKGKKILTSIAGNKFPVSFIIFLKEIVLKRKYFFKAKYYDPAHKEVFGNGPWGNFLLKAKYKIQKILGVPWQIN